MERGELTVGAIRRATAFKRNGPPASISAERVRESIATALVVDLPNAGEDVFTKAAELAEDDDIWKARPFEVDGQEVHGYETVHEGMWIAYCLMPVVILYVLAPVAQRLETVELRALCANEVVKRDD